MSSFNDTKNEITAELKDLVQSKALLQGDGKNFISATGRRMNWIFDFRILMMDGAALAKMAKAFWDLYADQTELQIATLELAGVPLQSAILVEGASRGKSVNGLIVRKTTKKYGTHNDIEGRPIPDRKTILIDDMINSGATIETCLLKLGQIGIKPTDCFSLLDCESPSFGKIKSLYNLASKSLFTLSQFTLPASRTGQEVIDFTRFFQTRWVFDPKQDWNKNLIFCKSDPLVIDEVVYWGTDTNRLYANRCSDGSLVWKFEGPEKSFLKGIWSSPCQVEDAVCFGSYDGSLYNLDRKTGKVIWINDHADFIGSSPCYSQEHQMIFVGYEFANPAHQGSVAGIDARDGSLVWEHRTHRHVHSSPVYSSKHDLVFCGSNDSDMMAFDAKTGKQRWRITLPGIVKMAPALNADQSLLAFGCMDGGVYLVEALTGNLVWSFRTRKAILATPTFAEHILAVSSCDCSVYFFDIYQRKLLGQVATGTRALSSPLYLNGSFFVGTNGGSVLEIETQNFTAIGSYQTPHRVPNQIAFDPKSQNFFAHTGDDRLFAFART